MIRKISKLFQNELKLIRFKFMNYRHHLLIKLLLYVRIFPVNY